MTIFRRSLATVAAIAALALPSVASAANPTASLSVAKSARASASAKNDSKLFGNPGGSTLLNIAILAALTVGVLVLVDNGGGNSSSP